ncbi:MAG TPA: hypothetical protein VNW53_19720 [Phenylobacterium sp.]|jgi:hypothetical protein|uniref:hypothetical protein n=1 Tax=Phenylobacterium sp. TaxID=1871053 RepID=UPI002CA99EAD|nr:hypothetical protein [Phenylobacterium sp.]HXA41240.1 hypothetical protein [Phenylobacterium sp.]
MLKDLPAQTRWGAEPPDVIAPLILDLLQWLAAGPRTYAEVMESWRTSCPRLTVWEDAVDGGYVVRRRAGPGHLLVEATPRGRDLLVAAGRA